MTLTNQCHAPGRGIFLFRSVSWFDRIRLRRCRRQIWSVSIKAGIPAA